MTVFKNKCKCLLRVLLNDQACLLLLVNTVPLAPTAALSFFVCRLVEGVCERLLSLRFVIVGEVNRHLSLKHLAAWLSLFW
jgi:hypothetical protein